MMIRKRGNHKGQIWVETVVYTLIGLSLIGLVLAIITPRINEFRDRSVIEQTINSLNAFDAKVNEVLSAPGNVRVVEMRMKRGELYFDSANNKIVFELNDSRSLYSEPGVEISLGRINITTFEGNKEHSVVITLAFAQDLTYNEDNTEVARFSAVSIPYKFSIENQGFSEGKFVIDIKETSVS
jgi:type II secretory pathway pseudopilin PulG